LDQWRLGATIVRVCNAEFSGKADEFRRALTRHVEDHCYSEVEFIECINPAHDPAQDDYFVAYEAIFRPRDLQRARLEVWVTDDGFVGVQFENRARLAERLGVRLWTAKQACAAGQELLSVTPKELISFVQLVAEGEAMLQVVPFGFGMMGLEATRAVVTPKSFQQLGAKNHAWDWLAVMTEEQVQSSWRKIVMFEPW
jgi:hypothetical protein